ncbi:anaerobic C4-dicarboxylate transporter [Corynebacterium camporealensis]|uniref:anaerobic C4-dicarboxylate transporter n=1 Tax=Corynebacterium camporealensis TaxID=161896 RepID=UPI000CF921CF|nr:anaerobic C4-dicarboxylate transporter [Corynebacterium camporealensis]
MLASVLAPDSVLAIILQLVVILSALLLGTRYGGLGLGLISGIGLMLMVFVFGLAPGEPPIDVMLTIIAVIGCAATLQQARGLEVMMQFAERILRAHPERITILAPITTWFLTVLCGTGHVVYTMFPIIEDIALKKGIRRSVPCSVFNLSADGYHGLTSFCGNCFFGSILAENAGVIDQAYSIPQILMVAIPASLSGVLLAALWSLRRGKDLDKDPVFQKRMEDPEFARSLTESSHSLLDEVFPATAKRSVVIFLVAIATVVVLGAFDALRPSFPNEDGDLTPLSMNLVIQMVMLVAGALILLTCNVDNKKIAGTPVFKAGMTAVFSVFGVAWMADTFFQTHVDALEAELGDVVASAPWAYAIVLLIVSKLVNSQAAALVAIAPIGLQLGIDPAVIVGFYGAAMATSFCRPTHPT